MSPWVLIIIVWINKGGGITAIDMPSELACAKAALAVTQVFNHESPSPDDHKIFCIKRESDPKF